ncbi:hypothetical protein SAMN05216302_1001104 [Nitrosomonas aestuarii]|uniref:Uncharacterized protein n=1 Tax=Nitrosomonas aestuarii TaxID=52441 RepID=A0A1I3X5W4_9PROT|nr:hypothetical protein SAMN05216302_1001104 [Nitrosomonas aestuarii]
MIWSLLQLIIGPIVIDRISASSRQSLKKNSHNISISFNTNTVTQVSIAQTKIIKIDAGKATYLLLAGDLLSAGYGGIAHFRKY